MSSHWVSSDSGVVLVHVVAGRTFLIRELSCFYPREHEGNARQRAPWPSANCPNPFNPLGSLESSQGAGVPHKEPGYLVRNRSTLRGTRTSSKVSLGCQNPRKVVGTLARLPKLSQESRQRSERILGHLYVGIPATSRAQKGSFRTLSI